MKEEWENRSRKKVKREGRERKGVMKRAKNEEQK
jgi:hypothetical protein